jgi:hypothetical protein
MIRPHAPSADRLVAEPPAETGHLRLHALDGPHPTLGSVAAVPEEFAAPPCEIERSGVFGLHDTDINQYVFTGAYVSLLGAHLALLVSRAGADVGRHMVDRIAVIFRTPFTAGAPYAVRGKLYRSGDRTLALIGVHPVGPGGPSSRSAVFGRVEGRAEGDGDGSCDQR